MARVVCGGGHCTLFKALHVRIVLKKFKKNAILDIFDGSFTDTFDFSMVNLIKFIFIVNIVAIN